MNLTAISLSRQVKQYSLEMAVGLLLLVLAERLWKAPARRHWIAYGTALCLSGLFSFGSTFVMAGTASALLFWPPGGPGRSGTGAGSWL